MATNAQNEVTGIITRANNLIGNLTNPNDSIRKAAETQLRKALAADRNTLNGKIATAIANLNKAAKQAVAAETVINTAKGTSEANWANAKWNAALKNLGNAILQIKNSKNARAQLNATQRRAINDVIRAHYPNTLPIPA
jgi:membrane-associated HD superfamily phosphohydrolase